MNGRPSTAVEAGVRWVGPQQRFATCVARSWVLALGRSHHLLQVRSQQVFVSRIRSGAVASVCPSCQQSSDVSAGAVVQPLQLEF